MTTWPGAVFGYPGTKRLTGRMVLFHNCLVLKTPATAAMLLLLLLLRLPHTSTPTGYRLPRLRLYENTIVTDGDNLRLAKMILIKFDTIECFP